MEGNRLLGRHIALWQRDYFDRTIRSVRRFLVGIAYIEENPVAAGL